MVDSWYCLDRIVPERMSQVSRRSEVGNHKQRTVFRWALLSNGYFPSFRREWARFGGDRRLGTINGALLTPGYLLALLNTLHQVREMYQVGWYGRICFGTELKSKWNRPIGTRTFQINFSEGSGPPLNPCQNQSNSKLVMTLPEIYVIIWDRTHIACACELYSQQTVNNSQIVPIL